MQYRIAGIAREALFAQTLRFIRLARIERCGRAANECLVSSIAALEQGCDGAAIRRALYWAVS